MAATVAIASGTTETTSSDITITAGSTALFYLVDAAGPSLAPDDRADIQIKASTGEYFPIGSLRPDNEKAVRMVYAPSGNSLTVRVLRYAGASFGVEYL